MGSTKSSRSHRVEIANYYHAIKPVTLKLPFTYRDRLRETRDKAVNLFLKGLTTSPHEEHLCSTVFKHFVSQSHLAVPTPLMMDSKMDIDIGKLPEPHRLSPTSEPASIPTLDGWIESLMNCKQLAETDVQRLCDRVSKGG